MSEDGFHLFTYGSLASARPGSPGARLLAGCERVTEGSVRGTLYDLGEYPALLLSGNDPVAGVIWRCPTRVLPVLDEYEGTHSGLFRRAAVRVEGLACWIYVAGPKLGPRLVPDARATSRVTERRFQG
jgi:gamma-glutamylcyclotransferase (GGCT)/AIG2-like uncharacterized protein YtfP